jgi:hypothetical protein
MTMHGTQAIKDDSNHVCSSGNFASLRLLNQLESGLLQGIQRSNPQRHEFLPELRTKIYATLLEWNRLVSHLLSGFSISYCNKKGDYR